MYLKIVPVLEFGALHHVLVRTRSVLLLSMCNQLLLRLKAVQFQRFKSAIYKQGIKYGILYHTTSCGRIWTSYRSRGEQPLNEDAFIVSNASILRRRRTPYLTRSSGYCIGRVASRNEQAQRPSGAVSRRTAMAV